MKTTSFLAVLWVGLMIVGLAAAAPPDRAAYNYYGYNSRPRPTRVYVQRYAAPQVVRAPAAVTPAPAIVADVNANAAARRTFSLEPKSAVQAPTATTGRRAYSYEPADVAAPIRMYQPATRSRTPAFLLQKSDPGKFR